MPFYGRMSEDAYADQHLGDGPSAVLRPFGPDLHRQQKQQTPAASELDSKDASEFQGLLVDKEDGGGEIGAGFTSLLKGRSQSPAANGSFLHLLTTSEATNPPMVAGGHAGVAPWVAGHGSSVMAAAEQGPVSGDSSVFAAAMFHGSGGIQDPAAGGGREGNRGWGMGGMEEPGGGDHGTWQNARWKAEILGHPLAQQLLAAHVACLRIATPVDQLPKIDAQLEQSLNVVAKYSVLGHQMMAGDDKELDQFMTHYVLLLCSFKEQLQQHVRVHAMEAVIACWELEQSLQSLTGVSPGEGTGATMSDDEDDLNDGEANLHGGPDELDSMGFGPLIPTERERSLMEQVRQELKNELKQDYKEKIVDIREEILRKRRAGKLPGNTSSVLKAWWQSHSHWPYPTEDEKSELVQETGLQLKQINNWFINQRKRNWHSNPSSSTEKIKRKR